MKLTEATWLEVEAYLRSACGIFIPTGSTEQHGPIGLIGTDALCAEAIADGAADTVKALVAPTLCYTPAPFNTSFPGTLSLSEPVYRAMLGEITDGLIAQGFRHIYFVNGHGANIAALQELAGSTSAANIRVRSWWDFDDVNDLRQKYYGDWEGMHATPSEVAITQALHRRVTSPLAGQPPMKLSAAYIKAHADDRHGPPDAHRRDFPDGRVGSHSALATPAHGRTLLSAAIHSVANDYQEWIMT